MTEQSAQNPPFVARGTPDTRVIVAIADLRIAAVAAYIRKHLGELTLEWARGNGAPYFCAVESSHSRIHQLFHDEATVLEFQQSIFLHEPAQFDRVEFVRGGVSPEFEMTLLADLATRKGSMFQSMAGHA